MITLKDYCDFSIVAGKVVQALFEVQHLAKASHCPKHLQELGLDNIVANCCLYDIEANLHFGKITKARRFLNKTTQYLDDILQKAGTYKPVCPATTWHGFDADLYYKMLEVSYIYNDMVELFHKLANKATNNNEQKP